MRVVELKLLLSLIVLALMMMMMMMMTIMTQVAVWDDMQLRRRDSSQLAQRADVVRLLVSSIR